jgi:hypothetical protein
MTERLTEIVARGGSDERRAHPIQIRGDPGRGAGRRALGQELGGEVGEPLASRRLSHRSRRHAKIELDERERVILGGTTEAVREIDRARRGSQIVCAAGPPATVPSRSAEQGHEPTQLPVSGVIIGSSSAALVTCGTRMPIVRFCLTGSRAHARHVSAVTRSWSATIGAASGSRRSLVGEELLGARCW